MTQPRSTWRFTFSRDGSDVRYVADGYLADRDAALREARRRIRAGHPEWKRGAYRVVLRLVDVRVLERGAAA